MNRLSDSLRAAADEPVDLDLGALHARVDHRRRRRARARAAACVVGVVAVLGGAGVAAGVGGSADGRAEDVGVDPSFTPESTSTVAEEPSTSTTPPDSSSTSTEVPTTSTEPPSTTSSTTPPSTVAPPTTAPAPTTVTLEGTYDVHSVPGAGSCSSGSFPVGLAGTVAASDGGVWARTEQGCAALVDGGYDATGTFVLTAPDGSTVTGSFRSVAALPTDGVPYGYQVAGGTGAYAGATGSCQLTVRIVAGVGSLDQRQEGEITCAITVGAGAAPGSDGEVPEAV